MGKIDNFLAGNAREEVFVAARKTDNFVREHRSADDEVIVIQDQPVQPDWDIFHQATIRDAPNLLRGDQADLHKRFRGFPVMVENMAHTGFAVYHLATDEVAQLFIAHGLVGSKRDQVIQSSHTPGKVLFEQGKHQRHGHAARAVGDQEQNTLAIQLQVG